MPRVTLATLDPLDHLDSVDCLDLEERRVTPDLGVFRESLARTDTPESPACLVKRDTRESRVSQWLDRWVLRETAASPDPRESVDLLERLVWTDFPEPLATSATRETLERSVSLESMDCPEPRESLDLRVTKGTMVLLAALVWMVWLVSLDARERLALLDSSACLESRETVESLERRALRDTLDPRVTLVFVVCLVWWEHLD